MTIRKSQLVWLALVAFCILAITCAPISALLNLFHDDSFFYMVIARNHAAGLGYTFDGLNQTNGFHLLWLWVLSAMGSLFALTGDQGIRIVVALQSLLSIGGTLLYIAMLSKLHVRSIALLVFFFAYLFLCTFADIGQESALFSFLFGLLIYRLFTLEVNKSRNLTSDLPKPISLWQTFSVLVLGALIVLSRLDSFFILSGIALAVWLIGQRKLAYALFIGITLGLTATMSFNYANFGHVYSISSWLKSGFDLDKIRQIAIPGLLIRVLLVMGLLLGALWNYRRLLNSSSEQKNRYLVFNQSWILTLTWCALLAYGGYFMVLFLEVSALGSWYFNQSLGFALFLFALSTTIGVKSTASFEWSIVPLSLALVVGAGLCFLKIGWAHSSDPTKAIGDWLAANTSPTAVIFQRDGAGAVSYFAQRHIINGDGLVNNMPYQLMLRSGKLCQYLKDQKVQYIVSNTFVNSAGKVQDFIFMWTKGVESIALTNVEPSKALFSSPPKPIYRVFELSDAAFYCL